MSDSEVRRYAGRIHSLNQKDPTSCMYPEWVLQELDRSWMDGCPSATEAFTYHVNPHYARGLLEKLGDGTGHGMERLGDYLLSCMPGCRVARREASASTDYDLVCSMDGFEVDFRSELGRYFVCECKDWNLPADFTTLAKFCRVLDSIKSRFGVLFSKNGISGASNGKHAANEQMKVFQDRGIVIVVIDEADLRQVAEGANFISMRRRKYEQVRLDLSGRNRPGN